MSRILLADDSPHAQRMGERILREEGFEVVTVTDGNTALCAWPTWIRTLCSPMCRFPAVPATRLPGSEGHPRHQHVRVVLTAGLLEPFDEAQAAAVRCDGISRSRLKPRSARNRLSR